MIEIEREKTGRGSDRKKEVETERGRRETHRESDREREKKIDAQTK